MNRVYALVARVLPAGFRARSGREMQLTLTARSAELRAAPLLRRARFWIAELADLLVTAAREWRRALLSPAPSGRVTRSPRPHALSLPERSFEMLNNIASDVRFAVRTLSNQPLFSVVVVLTLALGIGATTAVYTLVESVLLRPLPYNDPASLVVGYGSFPLNNAASVSPPDYLDYRDRSASFVGLAAIESGVDEVSIGGGSGAPEVATARTASSELFDVLGVEPVRGRAFTSDETRAGGPRVALISHGFWQRRFGADPDIVGQDFLMDEQPITVVGVLPADFELLAATDVWLPMQFGADFMTVRRFHFLRVIGRLRPQATLSAAQEEIDAIAADLAAAYPESNTDWTMRLVPLHTVVVGFVQQPLILVLAAVGTVLLIGCCNVAILLLARAARRAPEIAVRNALGASGRRIARLLLTESLLLALVGGGLGTLLAFRGVDLLIAMSATALPRLTDVSVDGSVLAFSLVLTLGTGVLFGTVPAWRSARRQAADAMRGEGRIVARGSQRLRAGLVVGQVALSFALLVGAGLTIRSFNAMTRAEPGYLVDNIASAAIELPATRYEEAEQRQVFFDELFARLGSMDTIEAAAGIDIMPQTGGNDTFAYPEGSPPEPGSQGFNAQLRIATAGYFAAMGIPVLSGRAFTPADVAQGNPVVVLDEPFAESIFPDEPAVGKRIVVDLGEPTPVTVVGVVGGVLHWSPMIGRYGTMYFPYGQLTRAELHVVMRAPGRAGAAIDGLRTALGELDPLLPLADVATMGDMFSGSIAGPRLRARLMGAFGVVALTLAVAGLYGVLAFFVAERRRDLGVRLALGADGGALVRMVMLQGVKLVSLGLLIGVPAAAAVSWAMEGLLYGVTAVDPISFAGVAAILVAVALLACLLPARRATRVDPLEVLRAE